MGLNGRAEASAYSGVLSSEGRIADSLDLARGRGSSPDTSPRPACPAPTFLRRCRRLIMVRQTREEYEANSLSRQQPWVAEGISRRTWYRRHKQPGGTSAAGGTSAGESSAGGTSPAGGTGPAGGTSAWRSRKLNLSGQDVARRVLLRLAALRLPHTDRKSVIKVVGDLYPTGKDAALKAYDRAVPPELDRLIFLTRQWGGRRLDATPEETYTLVLDLLRLAGPNRDRLVKWFASVEQQWGGEDKFSQALKLRDALNADPWVWPKRRPQRGQIPAIVEKILGLMRADVNRFWTNRQLARRLRRSYKSVWHITRSMCDRGLIVVVDEGKGLLALPEACVETRKSVSGRIIEKLIAAREMRFSPLARAIGIDPVAMSTPVQTLRRIGVLEAGDSAAYASARPPLRLSAEARAKIARKETIRDRRGFILWAPEADKIGI
jgi:hypothetical protein